MDFHDLTEAAKHTGDVVAATVTLGALFGFLPSLTAFFSFVYVCIRIYETKTVQRWLGR